MPWRILHRRAKPAGPMFAQICARRARFTTLSASSAGQFGAKPRDGPTQIACRTHVRSIGNCSCRYHVSVAKMASCLPNCWEDGSCRPKLCFVVPTPSHSRSLTAQSTPFRRLSSTLRVRQAKMSAGPLANLAYMFFCGIYPKTLASGLLGSGPYSGEFGRTYMTKSALEFGCPGGGSAPWDAFRRRVVATAKPIGRRPDSLPEVGPSSQTATGSARTRVQAKRIKHV